MIHRSSRNQKGKGKLVFYMNSSLVVEKVNKTVQKIT